MNPVEGGDMRLQPLNMTELGAPPEPAAPEEPVTDEETQAAARAIKRLRLIRGK